MQEPTEHGREIDSREAWALLKGLTDVHILIHRSPDGDCVGGGYALWHILNNLGIRAAVCCADPLPAVFASVTQGVTFEDFTAKTFVSVDVADRKLFGTLPDGQEEILLCIDHHISNQHYAKHLHWNPDASAACEVLYEMMVANHIPMTEEIALCLYLGMATDTGCFQYSNAGAGTFAAVSAIKAQYPQLPYAKLNRALFVQKSRGRLTLDARLMSDIQMNEKGDIALVYMPCAWVDELHLTAEETDGAANLPMQIIGVEIGITVKQQPEGGYRVSMRGGDHANVSEICQHFGGGGHIKAGGCSVSDGEPMAVCNMLMETAEAFLRRQLHDD